MILNLEDYCPFNSQLFNSIVRFNYFHFKSEIIFNPKYAELISTSLIKLENNDSSPLLIDSRFQKNQISLINEQYSINMNCLFINSSIVCQKTLFASNPVNDIYFLNFKILSNNVEMSKIQSELLVYSKKENIFKFKRKQHVNFNLSIGILFWKQCDFEI
jgi:hypothetical protein